MLRQTQSLGRADVRRPPAVSAGRTDAYQNFLHRNWNMASSQSATLLFCCSDIIPMISLAAEIDKRDAGQLDSGLLLSDGVSSVYLVLFTASDKNKTAYI